MSKRIVPCHDKGKPGFMVENTNGPCHTYSPDDNDSKHRAQDAARKQLTAVLYSQHKIGAANYVDAIKEALAVDPTANTVNLSQPVGEVDNVQKTYPDGVVDETENSAI